MLQYFDFDLSLIKKDTVDFKSVNDSRPFKKNSVLAKYHENWGGISFCRGSLSPYAYKLGTCQAWKTQFLSNFECIKWVRL